MAPIESLTIIVPIYNEEATLPDLCDRLVGVARSLTVDEVEVLLVSDGSTDCSDQIIARKVEENELFTGIFLTRNFGHQPAVSIGLEKARGDVVVVIDGDLQDPPEVIELLLDEILNGAHVAYAIRTCRKENLPKRISYFVFYRLLRGIASIDIPLDAGDFCCMRREVVDAMLRLPERNRFIRGLRAWVGYRQVGVEYERATRHAGQPKYTPRKLVELAYDGLFSFSHLPIRLIQWFGFGLSAFSLSLAAFYVAWYFTSSQPFPRGFATLVVSIWMLAGFQALFLGILGEYVFRCYDETRRRPVALVRQVLAHRDVAVDTAERTGQIIQGHPVHEVEATA